jgi:hypothetical protein
MLILSDEKCIESLPAYLRRVKITRKSRRSVAQRR